MIETFALVAAAFAAVTAFIVGVRKIVGEFASAARRQGRIDQALVAVDRLLHRELTNDGNGSLKSRVVKMGAQLDRAQADVATAKEQVGHVQDTLDKHLEDIDMHNSDPHAHPDT